jgi:hypothetical protein
MKKAWTLLLAILAGGMSYLAVSWFVARHAEAPAALAAPEHFPIVSRFELPRNYGYFLGDEIPLTLIVETTSGVVLDLVNLPKKGERHGLFEIRDVQLTTSATAEGPRVYRADYRLQYFGAAPLTTYFAPLELLYALPEDRIAPTNAYRYQSLQTQPVAINISRIGPYRPTQPLDIKGPVADSRSGMILGSLALGNGLLLTLIGSLGRQWYRRRQQRRLAPASAPTPVDNTLALLQHEGALLLPAAPPAFPGVRRLSHIMRQYLSEAFGVSASTLTNTELASLLHDKPFGKDLLDVLERCDTFKYRVPAVAPAEERQLWREAMTLFEQLQKVNAA